MPVPPLPPMTSRQAKRKNQKNPVKFKYSASQMRRADRIDELEERRRGLEDKERRRTVNKRKREEQDARDRALKQRLLKDGKISIEDTWGKVTASQPRLNSFFTKGLPRKDASLAPTYGLDKENSPTKVLTKGERLPPQPGSPVYDSQEDTLVDKSNTLHFNNGEDGLTDADLLGLLSPFPAENISGPASSPPSPVPMHPFAGVVGSKVVQLQPETAPSDSTTRSDKPTFSSTMAKQKRKLGSESLGTDFDLRSPPTPRLRRVPDFDILEDDTAEDFELPSSSSAIDTDVLGCEEAAHCFKGDRAPMRVVDSDGIFERSAPVTESRIIGNDHTTEVTMGRVSFRKHQTRAKLLNSRYNKSGLDLDEDRELLQMMQDRKEEVSARSTNNSDSPCSELEDLRATILKHKQMIDGAEQDSDTDDDFVNLRSSPIFNHLGAPETDVSFDDGGIDDDTLTALPDPTTFQANEVARADRFITIPSDPAQKTTLLPRTALQSPSAQEPKSTASFTSIDSDIFLAAEQQFAGDVLASFSTQDALIEAFESVEQEVEATAATEDAEMEEA